MLRAYINTRIFTGDLWLDGYAVLTENGRIQHDCHRRRYLKALNSLILKAIFWPPHLLISRSGGNGKLFPNS